MSNYDFENDNENEDDNINVSELVEQYEKAANSDKTPFFDQDAYEAIIVYYEEKGRFVRKERYSGEYYLCVPWLRCENTIRQ